MEVKILVTAQIHLADDLPDFAEGGPGEYRMRESVREAVSNALEFVRDEMGFVHDMDAITTIDDVECEIVSPACPQYLADNQDELDKALNREAAIRMFCEAEMGWEYFRAETKISDNPTQSMINAEKLRKYLEDNQEDPELVASRKELLDTLVDAEKMLSGIFREVTLHGEWEDGVSRLIDRCRKVISKTTQT